MNRGRKLIGAFLFLLLAAGCGMVADQVLNTNNRTYDRTDTPDAEGAAVLFVGTSQGASGICPVDIWDAEGIPAYNFSGAGQDIGITRYVVEDILKRYDPEVLVLDFEGMTRPEDFQTISNLLYNLPLISDLRLRYRMYREVIREEPVYFVPLFRYHNRWKELGQEDARRGHSILGSGSTFQVQTGREDLPVTGSPEAQPVGDRELGYLLEIRRLAEEKGCRLALADLPAYENEAADSKARWVIDWAEEQGIPVCHANSPEAFQKMGLAPSDFADEFHVNRSGEKKLSGYLAGWLADTFSLKDIRGSEEGAVWQRRVDACRGLDLDFWIRMAGSLDEFAGYLGQGETVTAVSLVGGYRSADEVLWPALEKLGLSREQYEQGGAFVRGSQGEWLFASGSQWDYHWGKALGVDELVVVGSTVPDETGNPSRQVSLFFDRKDYARTKNGANFLVYGCGHEDFLASASYDAEEGFWMEAE